MKENPHAGSQKGLIGQSEGLGVWYKMETTAGDGVGGRQEKQSVIQGVRGLLNRQEQAKACTWHGPRCFDFMWVSHWASWDGNPKPGRMSTAHRFAFGNEKPYPE